MTREVIVRPYPNWGSPSGELAPADEREPAVRPTRIRGERTSYAELIVAGVVSLMIIGAVATGSSTLALAGAALGLAAAVVSPLVGLMILALTVPLLARPIMPSPGFPFLLAAATLMGYVFRLPIERPRLLIGAPLLMLGAFVLYLVAQQMPFVLETYAGADGRYAGSVLARTLTGVFAVVATALLVRDRRPFVLLAALLISAAVSAVVAFAMLIGGPAADLFAELVAKPDQVSRPSGTFADPNYFGVYMASATVLAASLWAGAQSRRWRAVLVITCLVLALGLLASQSRTGIIATVVGLAVLLTVRDVRKGLLFAAVALAVGVISYPILIELRLENSLGAAAGDGLEILARSDQGRVATVLAGMDLFLASPILGSGFASYHIQTGDASHNWYMTVVAEQGIVGSLIWMGLIASAAYVLWHRPLFPRSTGLALLVLMLVGSMFLDLPREEQYSVLTAMVIASAIVGNWAVRPRGTGARPVRPARRQLRSRAS